MLELRNFSVVVGKNYLKLWGLPPPVKKIVSREREEDYMDAYRLLRAGLVADVIVLVIGVVAAALQIPYALQIIVAALAALAPLIHAISRQVNPSTNRNGRNGRQRMS